MYITCAVWNIFLPERFRKPQMLIAYRTNRSTTIGFRYRDHLWHYGAPNYIYIYSSMHIPYVYCHKSMVYQYIFSWTYPHIHS